MRRSFILLFTFSIIILTCTASNVKKEIVNLRTNYEVNPLGIEEKPHFSWEMKASSIYGAQQRAYQIQVADSKNNLKTGKYVYDTGKKLSGISVNIPYAGIKLKPCTRYYWKVKVWDENNKTICSNSDSWFETALINSGWNGAQWIGSHSTSLSKYTGRACIDFDFTVEKGSNQAAFILGYRGENDYVKINFDFSKKDESLFIITYKYNGKENKSLSQDITQLIKPEVINEKHHVKIDMVSLNYFNGYKLDIEIDGKNINSLSSSPKKNKPHTVTIQQQNTGYNQARLYGIGFLQEKGQNAKFENLVINEKRYGEELYRSKKLYDIKGDGKIIAWTPNEDVSAPQLRKTFIINKNISSARLYATARGIYEMSINGKDVSNDFFNPGWPDYRFRQTYNTFDVTNLLKEGKNAIGAILGMGYFTGPFGYNADWSNGYGTQINLMAKLVINYIDGTQDIIITDPSWKYSDNGPILENSFFNGEDYDARKEIKGWNTAEFNDDKWKNVAVYPALADSIKVSAYIGQPVRAEEICEAKKLTEPLKGHFIYDMGQNMVGVPRIFIKGKEGQEITVHYAEMLYPDVIPTDPVPPYTIDMYKEKKGQMYLDNYRGALSTDHYICKGSPEGEIFEPHFTSHGFRYIEITGIDSPLELKDVKVLVLNSMEEITANYETDNKNVNQLYNNIIWGQKGNFLAVPTDCPQRDERLGWTGDAQIFTRTATYNRNVQPFFNRWLQTLRDDQSVLGGFPRYAPMSSSMVNDYYNNAGNGWSDVGVITPWEIYQQYGDKSILEKSYESMKRYIAYLDSKHTDYIMPYECYGDWVALLGTPSDLTNTAYTAHVVNIVMKIAKILGKNEDAQKYKLLFEKFQNAFLKRFVDKDGWMIMPAGSPATRDSYSAAYNRGPKISKDTIQDSQTAYILPLYAGLIPDNLKDKVAAHLAELLKRNNYHLNTGFIGTPYMNIVLSDNGYDDIAYKMFQQDEYPSWIYPILQGATTIWERWNSYTLINGFGPVDMNSFNHYSYGAIQDWMMAYGAGIQRDENAPGYKHIILQPRIGGTLGYTCAKFNSVYGEIASSWNSTKTDENADASKYGYTYHAIVPANTTATLTLPLNNNKNIIIEEGKKGITSVVKNNDKIVYELQSGSYRFIIK